MAVAALAAILAITAAWWALALWPLPAAGPAWLLRTRAVCFGTTPSGLPDTYGWMTLIGEPVLMLGMLYMMWGESLAAGLRALASGRVGRMALTGAVTLLITALVAAGMRVANAAGARVFAPALARASEFPRLDRQAPALDLVDQHGDRVTLGRFRGRPILLTFAYGHCTTVCPLVVRDVLRARELARDRSPAVIIVTLDPWRDTPSRLPAIAEQWHVAGDALIASGDTAVVSETLSRWHVAAQRDLRTGGVAHATLVYLVDCTGRVAYEVDGSMDADALVQLVGGL